MCANEAIRERRSVRHIKGAGLRAATLSVAETLHYRTLNHLTICFLAVLTGYVQFQSRSAQSMAPVLAPTRDHDGQQRYRPACLGHYVPFGLKDSRREARRN